MTNSLLTGCYFTGWLDGCASQHNVVALQFGLASSLKVAVRMKNGLITGWLIFWLAGCASHLELAAKKFGFARQLKVADWLRHSA